LEGRTAPPRSNETASAQAWRVETLLLPPHRQLKSYPNPLHRLHHRQVYFDALVGREPKIRMIGRLPVYPRNAWTVEKPGAHALRLRYFEGWDKVAITREKCHVCNLSLAAKKGKIEAQHQIDPFLFKEWLPSSVRTPKSQAPFSHIEPRKTPDGIKEPPLGRIASAFIRGWGIPLVRGTVVVEDAEKIHRLGSLRRDLPNDLLSQPSEVDPQAEFSFS